MSSKVNVAPTRRVENDRETLLKRVHSNTQMTTKFVCFNEIHKHLYKIEKIKAKLMLKRF